MFEEIVWQHEDVWSKYLTDYGDITFEFSLPSNLVEKPTKMTPITATANNQVNKKSINVSTTERTIEPQGPISQKLMDLFPGVVTLSKK
jgi:hypothetical protein